VVSLKATKILRRVKNDPPPFYVRVTKIGLHFRVLISKLSAGSVQAVTHEMFCQQKLLKVGVA